ncbi:unnamed protein product, partial [Rotaria magnacalcarata]
MIYLFYLYVVVEQLAQEVGQVIHPT